MNLGNRKRHVFLLGGLLILLPMTALIAGAISPWQSMQSSQSSPVSRVLRDISYGSDSAQRMDVYLPANPYNAPVLMMVHGGAWMIGNKQNAAALHNKLDHWSKRGYIIISVDYRLVPDTNPLGQVNDVARALAFAQNKAETWGGDPARFVLMGHSAGAHLVSLLASSPSLVQQNNVKPWLGTISLDSAALNLAQIMQAPHMGFYDKAFGKDASFWETLSPFTQLKEAPKPMLMVCSTRRAISCFQSEQFAERANQFGGSVTVLPVDLSHRDINWNLGAVGNYTDSVDAFLHRLNLP